MSFTHLQADEKERLFEEVVSAIKAAVLPILEREHGKGSCPNCIGRAIVAALAERCGSVAATVASYKGDAQQQQFLVSMLVQASFAQELARLKTDGSDDDLATMPTAGLPS